LLLHLKPKIKEHESVAAFDRSPFCGEIDLRHGIEKQAQSIVIHSGYVFRKKDRGLAHHTVCGPFFDQDGNIVYAEVLGGKDSGVVFNFAFEEEQVVWIGYW
jgi:hypothetical protein